MALQPVQIAVPGGVELLVIGFIFLFTMVVPLAIAFLVYRDASGRNSDHALAWGLGAFFGGLVVWILYAVVRDEIGSRPSV